MKKLLCFFLFLSSCGNLKKTNELLEESLNLNHNLQSLYQKSGLSESEINFQQLESIFNFFKASLLWDFSKMLKYFQDSYGQIPNDVILKALHTVISFFSEFMEYPFTNGE